MKKPRIHLEIQHHRSNPIGLLRTTFRDSVNRKIKHTQHGRITGAPLDTLLNVQAALKGEVIRIDDPAAFKVIDSRELGASAALLDLAKAIGLPTAIYSRPSEPWVQDILAMSEQEEGIKQGRLELKDRKWTVASVLEALKTRRKI